MKIQVLDPATAAKIAAGEVVERPASVVKELVENSLDAGATQIRVELRGGGREMIRVIDDGCGIAADEIELAFLRHATSKIRSVEDIYSLHTMGFRGEALPSIAAVSRLNLVSRIAEAELGVELELEGGTIVESKPRGCSPGTIISVRDIFFNVPARQKFLKSATAEAAAVHNLLSQLALAYPAVRFTLVNDSKVSLQTMGNGELLDTIGRIYGVEVAAELLPLSPADFSGLLPSNEGPAPVRVTGYISRPSFTRANRTGISLFVNGRWVQSRMILYAIEEAYHSLIMTGRHPLAVLSLEIDPATIDANVHPQKTEVKFADERAIFRVVQRTVRQTLLGYAEVRSLDLGTALTNDNEEKRDGTPSSSTEASGDDTGREGWQMAVRSPTTQLTNVETYQGRFSVATDPPDRSSEESGRWQLSPPSGASIGIGSRPVGQEEPVRSFTPGLAYVTPPEATPRLSPPSFLPSQTMVTSVRAEDTPLTPPPRLSILRVVGQMSNTYIVAEGPDGMYLVDQHAAHERILFEIFQVQQAGLSINTQSLLIPVPVVLRPEHLAEIDDLQEEMSAMGFQTKVAPADSTSGAPLAIIIEGVPAILPERSIASAISDLLDGFSGADGGKGGTKSDLRLRAAATLACHGAIRAGQALSVEEMRRLIAQLEATNQPRACAHGRPTMLHLSAGLLEKEFGRKGSI